jgi:putative hydrolase of the HAD superfamily
MTLRDVFGVAGPAGFGVLTVGDGRLVPVAGRFSSPAKGAERAERVSMSWVLFDFGGVICTPQPDEDLAALAAAAGRVSVADFQNAYWPSRTAYDLAALTATEFWRDVAARLGQTFTSAQVDELVRLDIASWAHMQEGTLALIRDLEAAGQRLALLSNMPVECARAVTGLPVARHFEQLLFSCDFRAGKPDHAFYGRVLDRLGVPAAEVTFIDDRQENVAGAARMGMRAIRFTDPEQARAGLAGIIGRDGLLSIRDLYTGGLCAG